MTTLNFNNINKLEKRAGIYMIQNLLNGHKYVGSTNNFKRGLTKHRSELRTNKHHSISLQRAYNKYGEDKFVVVILEVCQPIHDTLLFLEQKYLDLNPEYNCVKRASRKYSKIPILKQENKVKRKVEQYTLSGEYVRTFDSISDAARYIDENNYFSIRTCITDCCCGKLTKAVDYLWKYANDNRDIAQVVRQKQPRGIKVDQLDLNGNYIQTFSNMTEAAKYCGSISNRSTLNKVCRNQKKTAFGFKWRYNYDK